MLDAKTRSLLHVIAQKMPMLPSKRLNEGRMRFSAIVSMLSRMHKGTDQIHVFWRKFYDMAMSYEAAISPEEAKRSAYEDFLFSLFMRHRHIKGAKQWLESLMRSEDMPDEKEIEAQFITRCM
jgi:hypothetical protein